MLLLFRSDDRSTKMIIAVVILFIHVVSIQQCVCANLFVSSNECTFHLFLDRTRNELFKHSEERKKWKSCDKYFKLLKKKWKGEKKARTHIYNRNEWISIDLTFIILCLLSMRKTSSILVCPFEMEKIKKKKEVWCAHLHPEIDYISSHSIERLQRSKRGKNCSINVKIELWN